MNVPTARAIYEAAETAIYELLVDGKSEAQFQGRRYAALDLPKLMSVRDHYKAEAIANGELPANANTQRVTCSLADLSNVDGSGLLGTSGNY